MTRYLTCLLALTVASRLLAEDSAAIALKARTVLRHHCLQCHSGKGSTSGKDFDMMQVSSLIAEFGVVVAKDPDNSLLLQKVLDDEMPPKSIPERVTKDEQEVLRQWIVAGAPDFPTAKREFIPLETVLTAIRDYLRKQKRKDRPYLRFFTIHNLHNNPRVLDKDLRIYRAALSKAANSLSQKSRIVLPVAIDRTTAFPKERQGFLTDTVFVVDTRDFGWDQHNLWQEVLSLYPYGLSYGNLPEDRLQKLNEDLEDLSGCEIPLIRADWFVANATRPPLYHDLLGIPKSAAELERDLSVDIRASFLDPTPDRIARAAFAKSGVSGQNRMVERNESREGMYWKSYDFKPDSGRSKLTRFPLGPRNLFPAGKHPFDAQAFEQAGGEVIWRLPNGLQAYLLVNGKGDRIDTGPIQVVSDALKTSGTPEIVNGVSCMACHDQGMKPFTDALRDHSAVLGEADRQVKRLYLQQDQMKKFVDEDRDVFLRAVKKCIAPFLQVGDDKDKPIEEVPEPVGEVARWHRLVYLDLATVACELDVKDPQELLVKVGQRKLKQLGLESLLERDGVVGRLEWEAFDGPSLMQELARELRYTPDRPLSSSTP